MNKLNQTSLGARRENVSFTIFSSTGCTGHLHLSVEYLRTPGE